MRLHLHGGPLDGLTLNLPAGIDKLVTVDDMGRVARYETESTWEEQNPEKAGGDARLASDVVEFDAELVQALGGHWEGST